MTGVDSIPTMFMTTSFGCIMQDFGAKKLKKEMIFKNITKVQIENFVCLKKYFNFALKSKTKKYGNTESK